MRTVRIVIITAFVVALLAAAGCAASTATKHPAAQTIQRLLELREDDVRDAAAYADYFEESALATAVAEGSLEATGTRQVPRWKRPYVSEETTDGASVVVIWKATAGFDDWPFAHIYSLRLLDSERWVVVDAVETTSPPDPLVEK